MKLNFQIVTTLLIFCTTGKTVEEMKHRLAFDHTPKLVNATIDFMIKQNLITQEVNVINSLNKQPTKWVKNISLECYAIKKAG
ncbi:hypothetical protein ACR30L_07750 [Psychromonas sp. PT13]|uniref:hypothetical protein n=1 Tax=Psychromonas sp. PT13 TaxID=3439547 RepID=UPI003EBAED44